MASLSRDKSVRRSKSGKFNLFHCRMSVGSKTSKYAIRPISPRRPRLELSQKEEGGEGGLIRL